MNGKGSARRPGTIPAGAWDRIFNRSTSMIDIEDEPPHDPKKEADMHKLRQILDAPMLCGEGESAECCPTDDGPGQEGANERPPYERRKHERN